MISRPSTYVGVAVSVAGNIVISLALNIQKYAHARLDKEAEANGNGNAWDTRNPESSLHRDSEASEEPEPGRDSQDALVPRVEVEPPTPQTNEFQFPQSHHSNKPSKILVPSRYSFSRHYGSEYTLNDEDDRSHRSSNHGSESPDKENYLKSKLWWLGLFLMAVGEAANFMSYGLAAASVVAPLGTVALVANCVIAPLMLHEKFGWKDIVGVVLAILGAVTVVLSAKQQEKELDPKALLEAIKRPTFIAYSIIVVVLLAGLLAVTHSRKYGDRWVVVDVIICALFGGFTVLSTKALSTLLSSIFLKALAYQITWYLIVVLLGTSLLQIKYLNKALQSFESREVIPTQFVFFTISAIVGSAVLYQEFENLTASRFANFLFGMATTFVGVFFLTQTKNTAEEEDADDSHSAGISTPNDLRRLESLPEEEPLLIAQAIPTHTGQRLRKRASTTSLQRHVLAGGGYILIATSPPGAGNLARSFEGRTTKQSPTKSALASKRHSRASSHSNV